MMTRILRGLHVVVATAGLLPILWQDAGCEPFVYIANSLFTNITIVDVATGDRRNIDLYHYPGIIKNGNLTAASETSVYVETVSALQWTGIFHLDSVTEDVTPVSGDVLADASNLLGDGPDFQPGLRGLIPASGNALFAVRAFQGLMGVEAASGNRTVLSQSDPPAVGEGIDLNQPGDVVRLPGGDVLLVEAFEGLVRINPGTGNRIIAAPNMAFQLAPERIERLADGRILHSSLQLDNTALFAFNLATQTDELVSGAFGGVTRGAGPGFSQVLDITVLADGRAVAYDAVGPTLFLVEPKSGDRQIVSGGPGSIGEGDPLPEAIMRPVLAAYQPNPDEKPAGVFWLLR